MKSGRLIETFLWRKQQEQPGYSLSALARDLKVSPSFLSEALAGKKKVPVAWIKPISRILGLDDLAVAELKAGLLFEHIQDSDLRSLIGFAQDHGVTAISAFKPIDRKKLSALAKWYYIAVLDLLTLHEGPRTDQEVANRLNLSVAAAREALQILENLGLVIKDSDGNLQKTDKKLRFPTTKSDPSVRNFHGQMIEKAKLELLNKTKDGDFSKRLIFGATVAADPSKLDKVKHRLMEAVAQISAEFSEGSPTELYQINLQLFPLTTPKS